MTLPDPIAWAVPVFILTMLAEAWVTRLRPAYEVRDTAASMLLGMGNLAITMATTGVMLGIYAGLYQHRWATWPIHGPAATAAALTAAFVLYDLCYYWGHRFSHEIRLGWVSHRVHHSSLHFNFATAVRQPWIDLPTLVAWLPFGVMPLLGVSPATVLFVGGLSKIYSYFQHTETVARLPAWCEFVFATPSHHRVHHATNPRYLDANYGNTFIIWDRLFGTFVAESDDERCRYGLISNVASFNPVRIVLGEATAMAADVRHAPDWTSRFAYVFGAPGYSHDGARRTAQMLKSRPHSRIPESQEPGMETDLLERPRSEPIAAAPSLRSNAPSLRSNVDSLRSNADSLRSNADILRGNVDSLRSDADSLRGTAKILIVDDDHLVRMVTSLYVQELGHEPIEAESAEEAYAILHAGTAVDVVLSDVVMPGADGATLAMWLRAIRPELPVILMTGYAGKHNVAGERVIMKPFSLHELNRQLTAALLGDMQL